MMLGHLAGPQELKNQVLDLDLASVAVDDEQLRKPAHWDIGFIRRFMSIFGPLSSIFDFTTSASLIVAFGARSNADLFRSGWFVESLLTQTLVVFVIRTRRSPFWTSPPARPLLLLSTLGCAALAIPFPYSPLADTFGFTAPSPTSSATCRTTGIAVHQTVVTPHISTPRTSPPKRS